MCGCIDLDQRSAFESIRSGFKRATVCLSPSVVSDGLRDFRLELFVFTKAGRLYWVVHAPCNMGALALSSRRCQAA